MVELVVFACLVAAPAQCERLHLPFQAPMGLTQCVRESQFLLVEWAEKHPGWEIRRWRCAPPEA